LATTFAEIEQERKVEQQSHLEAMEKSQEWHERDLEAKVEQRLANLKINN
jgi:hypothetical protein